MDFQFDSMSDFWNMGGYAFYVWASFFFTFLCMAAILFQSLFVSVKIRASVQKETARAQRIMAARAARKQKQQAKATSTVSKAKTADEADTLPVSQSSHSSDIKEVIDEPKT